MLASDMALQRHTKVFTVFSFLRLRSEDIGWYQWIYPTAVFLVVYGAYRVWGAQFFTFDMKNFIAGINALMGILVGFYIAALAAVSSFTNENLDQVMKGRAPTLTSIRQGKEIKETLTRRRFLAILFGYCAMLSIMLYIFGAVQANIEINRPVNPLAREIYAVGKEIAWAGYVWMLSSLLVVTLLGLHYLVERMHRA